MISNFRHAVNVLRLILVFSVDIKLFLCIIVNAILQTIKKDKNKMTIQHYDKQHDRIQRQALKHLELAFQHITESLDKISDLDLDFETRYNLEDIQFDIQNTIDSLTN